MLQQVRRHWVILEVQQHLVERTMAAAAAATVVTADKELPLGPLLLLLQRGPTQTVVAEV
jgi:hypothetical protein